MIEFISSVCIGASFVLIIACIIAGIILGILLRKNKEDDIATKVVCRFIGIVAPLIFIIAVIGAVLDLIAGVINL